MILSIIAFEILMKTDMELLMKRFLFLVGIMLGLAFAPAQAQESNILTDPWNAQYFNNPYLAGRPNIERQDNAVGFDWGTDAPANNIPADNFSVRWSKGGNLAAGTYRFIVTADLGFRIYLDGQVILDTWDGGASGVTIGRDIFIEAGHHNIQIDYHDFEGHAYIWLDWGFAPNGAAAPQPTAQVSGNTVTITANTLNVRSEPRIANNVISRVSLGQQFVVIGRSADGLWVQLDLGNGQTGWVSAAYVSDSATAPQGLSGLTLRSTVRLLVRAEPDVESDAVSLLLPSETAQIIGRSADGLWWKINDGGTVGWVSARFVVLSPDVDPNAIQVVD
jgi:uncharacterized protein YgiM (DUF1202 family)